MAAIPIKPKSGRQSAEDFKELQQRNALLSNTVRELRLEMGYYKGETKRLDLEKRILVQEASNAQASLQAVSQFPQAKIFQDPEYLHSLVNYPSKSISDVLQMQDVALALTSSQAPFFIEYANKCWAEICGWEPHDIFGLTTSFLQGPLTDRKTTANFMRDVQEFGYGNMRIINYRRSGEMFICTIKVFPVFDSVRPTGPDCEVPVLTHFAVVVSSVEEIIQDVSGFFKGPDRRLQSKKIEKKCRMQPESFLSFASSIRLSDLFRFLLCCEDALVLTDAFGHIIHANRAWSNLTGYSISEIEGYSCSFLHGPRTNMVDVERCNDLVRSGEPAEMVVINYRKDRTEFINHVMIVPIRGGFKTSVITHYCALLIAVV